MYAVKIQPTIAFHNSTAKKIFALCFTTFVILRKNAEKHLFRTLAR